MYLETLLPQNAEEDTNPLYMYHFDRGGKGEVLTLVLVLVVLQFAEPLLSLVIKGVVNTVAVGFAIARQPLTETRWAYMLQIRYSTL